MKQKKGQKYLCTHGSSYRKRIVPRNRKNVYETKVKNIYVLLDHPIEKVYKMKDNNQKILLIIPRKDPH